MTDPDEIYETMMKELDDLTITAAGLENKEEEEICLSQEQEDEATGEIHLSLLPYIEASKRKTVAYEKLILQDLEDVTVLHCIEGFSKDFASDFDDNPVKLNEQAIPEIGEQSCSTDPSLPPALTETEALFNESVCLNDKVTEELEGDNHLECERRLLLELRALESAQKEQEERTTIGQLAEREKRQREQREKEDSRRLRERHLEDQLRRREEAEKILLEDLEMTKRAAEEKLALELHRQQAVISSLQKQVEEERRAFEEAQEEERRSTDLLRHRAAMTLQAAVRDLLARRRAKAQLRRRREEQGRREEQLKRMRELEEEARRRENEAQEREVRRAEYERAKEEERARLERERRRREEEEQSRSREEEERRKQEEVEKRRREQDEKRKREEERRRQEEEIRTQEEVEKRREEEGKRKKEEEKMRSREEEMRKQQEENRRVEEERRKKEEEKSGREEEERRKRKVEEDKRWMEEQNRKMEGEREKEEEERRMEEERRKRAGEEQNRKTGDLEDKEGKNMSEGENKESAEETKRTEKEVGRKLTEEEKEREEGERRANDLQRRERERELGTQSEEEARDDNGPSTGTSSNPSLTPTNPSSSEIESSISQTTDKVAEHSNKSKDNTELTPNSKTICGEYLAVSPSTTNLRPPDPLPMCLPEHTEEKRLSWMKDCVPWSKLALQNRRKQRGTAQSRKVLRRGTEVSSLPPLCPETLLQAGRWTSLQEVTTVILEDLPGCSLSTLAQCPRLQSLTLRRCGLKALDGFSQCSELCYIDVQENEITFVDCEKLSNLRILRLGHNRLSSIHGLGGTVNLDVLELSYNSITRIAGLESMKRLQRLCVDHNQLISTRGLREVYTLLHLDCSHNHLNRVEGLENCALLNTLDLRANSLTEPPCLSNQVLLRQLFLDDNSLSSLDSLTDCWLPLLQELSGAQNSITQLSSLSDCVSLESLDISHNCLSELRNVCESLRGCPLLQQVHLTGNPLLQESKWRATLLRAMPGLRATSGQETDPPPSPPAGHRGTLSPGSFLSFCHAQLQQTHHLQQLQIRKLSGASSPLAVLKLSCHHHTEALRLAEEHRYAHEYGDTALSDKCRDTALSAPEPTPDLGNTDTESTNTRIERECSGNMESHSAPPLSPMSGSDAMQTVVGEESDALESGTGVNPGYPTSRRAAERQKTTPPESIEKPTPDPLTADLKKQGHANTPSSLTETDERGGEGGGEERPTHTEQSVFHPDRAATAIQALWRGHLLRKRLASALASAMAECSNAGEDDDLEGLDMDEFVFDETALETDWLPTVTEDTLPRCPLVSSQTSCPKDRLPPPVPTWRLRQAWVAGEEMEPPGQRVSPEKTNRMKSPPSSVPDGLSERSEKILEEWGFSDSHTALMMLKRAQRMTSKKPQQKKVMDPMVRLDIFRNCANHCGPVEARKRPVADKRDLKGADGEAELGLVEQMSVNQERTQQWLHSQHAHSESEHFLPEIDPKVLIGGRVQLVASPGYRRLWGQTVGLWANNSSVSPPRKERSPPHRNSWGHAKQEVLSPERVTSSPLKKERISFRDNPVQMSGGWGGGKKREKVPK